MDADDFDEGVDTGYTSDGDIYHGGDNFDEQDAVARETAEREARELDDDMAREEANEAAEQTKNGGAETPGAAAAVKKKRKIRAPRRKKALALNEALADADVNLSVGEPAKFTAELRAARDNAIAAIDSLGAVLGAVQTVEEKLNQYLSLQAQMQKHSKDSAVLSKLVPVFRKHALAIEGWRKSIAQTPELYRRLLLKQIALERGSVAQLAQRPPKRPIAGGAPVAASETAVASLDEFLEHHRGKTVTADNAALVLSGGKRAFHFTMEHGKQATGQATGTKYFQTSSMRANFSPDLTAPAMSAARLDRQRRQASKVAHQEVVPALLPARQMLLSDAVLDASVYALPAPTKKPRLANEPAWEKQ